MAWQHSYEKWVVCAQEMCENSQSVLVINLLITKFDCMWTLHTV